MVRTVRGAPLTTPLPPVPPPAPAASSPTVRRIMQRNRSVDTKPEVLLRSLLHRHGLRFRKNVQLNIEGQRIRPDVVFGRLRMAVFVDGCFWHRCPVHGNDPRTHSWYWGPKLDRNVARDRLADAALRAAGWEVRRIWSHEDISRAAESLAIAIAQRRAADKTRASILRACD
jgi:DNA mismatch endonuclease (patch repair protein)